MKKVYFLGFFIFLASLGACKPETPTLQQYIVSSREDVSFQSLDLSTSMLDSYLNLTDSETRESIKSVNKVSLLGLTVKGNEEKYEAEKTKLNNVLSNSKKYKSLLKVKKQGIKFNLYYKGTTESINEVIVFAHAPNYGLGLARLLGDNIKTDKIIQAIQKMNLPKGVLNGLE